MIHRNIKAKLIRVSPWLIIFLASFLLFYKYLLQVFPSVITDELMRSFQLTGAGLGNLAAFFFYSYLVVQFFSGYLIDRFNMKYIIVSSVLISALGALLFSLADNYTGVVAGRILMGAGAAFATVGYMKTAAVYFPPSRFALVSGLLTVGVMLGAVFGEAPLAILIKSIGWQHALMVVAFAGVVISALFLIFVKNKPAQPTNLIPTVQQRIKLSDITKIFKSKTTWYLTLYSGLAFAPLAVFGGLWGTPFMIKAYHISRTHAALNVSVVYIGFGLGGPLLGYLADRFRNRFRFMKLGLVLSLISICSIIYLTPATPILIALTFLFGFSTGAFMLGFAVGKDINPIYMAATVIALINSGDAICGALSEPLIGKILDVYNHGKYVIPTHFQIADYRIAFITLPVELLLAFFFLRLARKSVTSKQHATVTSPLNRIGAENT